MNKTTIEISRVPGHISGYGFLHGWPKTGEQDVLEELLAWSQLPENQGKKVYRHIVRTEEGPPDYTKVHYASEHGLSQKECAKIFNDAKENKIAHNCGMIYRHPTCDALTLLDIYYQ